VVQVHFVVEIPKFSRAKFEIATGEALNPIKQDTKKGQLRNYNYGDMPFNYGCFPQTWEDPAHTTPDTGAIGGTADPNRRPSWRVWLQFVHLIQSLVKLSLHVARMDRRHSSEWIVVSDGSDAWRCKATRRQ